MRQARKSPRREICRPVINIPLRDCSGETISLDCFGPSPSTRSAKNEIFLFTDRFSRRAVIYTISFQRIPLSEPPKLL